MSATIRSCPALTLKRRARGDEPGIPQESTDEARAELRRRLGNLKDAVVPDWEKAARGAVVARWRLW